jgi:hypothetical protein
MLFYFLKIVFLISHVIASRSDKEIYNEARETILSLSKDLYGQQGEITRMSGVISSDGLDDLDSSVLVKLMIDDISDEFLTIYFFAYSFKCYLLIFRNINSLCALKSSPLNKIHLIKIFENFRRFLFLEFVYTKEECCSDFKKAFPSNSSDLPLNKNFWERGWITLNLIYEKFKDFLCLRPAKSPVEGNYEEFISTYGSPANFELLKNLEFLWKNRLERLAKLLLSVDEFDKVSNQIKDTFDFLNSFLKYGLEFMLIKEYKGLYDDLQTVDIENSSTLRNFMFLVRHFVEHLNESGSIAEGLGMLASKTPEFIILFCFIYDEQTYSSKIDSERYKHLLSRNLVKMHKSVKFNIKPIKGGFYVFFNKVIEPEGIYFANKIRQKTNDFLQKNFVEPQY